MASKSKTPKRPKFVGTIVAPANFNAIEVSAAIALAYSNRENTPNQVTRAVLQALIAKARPFPDIRDWLKDILTGIPPGGAIEVGSSAPDTPTVKSGLFDVTESKSTGG